MKYSNTKLFALAAMITATLCVASAYGGKMLGQARGDTHVILRLNKTTPDSFDALIRGGKVVGMTAVMKDGSRLALKAQSKPTCSMGCPDGQVLTCWEDHDLQMSICTCGSGGGGASGVFRLFGDANGDSAVGR